MNLLDRVRKLMEERNDNNASLARNSGIPYTTIDGLFKRGWEKAQLSTIQKIADYYNVSLDYLVYGAQGLSEETLLLASKIDALKDPFSIDLIKYVVEIESKRAKTVLKAKAVPILGELIMDGTIETKYAAKKELQELSEIPSRIMR